MKIGIIAAENKEMLAIKEIMNNIKEEKIYNLNIVIGNIFSKECVLVECGVGKVNSARTTQILIDKYNVDCIINVGSAGAVNPELNIEDIVIGDKFVQFDFDLTGLGYEKGEVCGGVGKFIKADEKLVEICKKSIEELNTKNKIKIGTIGSSDMFCSSTEIAQNVREEFGAECVEMEGAAIAQVCLLDKIPFLVIRAISDSPNGNNGIDFNTFLEIASKRAAEILNVLIKNLC